MLGRAEKSLEGEGHSGMEEDSPGHRGGSKWSGSRDAEDDIRGCWKRGAKAG